MKKLGLVISILMLMCGCGRAPSSLIIVTVTPSDPPGIDQGQAVQVTANLADNASSTFNATVVWTVTGPGCAGASCGTFSNVTATSAIYNAPLSVQPLWSSRLPPLPWPSPTQSGWTNFTVNPSPSIVTNLPTVTPDVNDAALKATGGVLH